MASILSRPQCVKSIKFSETRNEVSVVETREAILSN